MGTNVSEAARKAFFSGRDEDATAEMSCSGGFNRRGYDCRHA